MASARVISLRRLVRLGVLKTVPAMSFPRVPGAPSAARATPTVPVGRNFPRLGSPRTPEKLPSATRLPFRAETSRLSAPLAISVASPSRTVASLDTIRPSCGWKTTVAPRRGVMSSPFTRTVEGEA